tara:strand:+ start:567 stop:710 length:144 start_codon:yes stop_codon:yes gene_type:complete
MTNWFKSLSIKELSTWIEYFDKYQMLPNYLYQNIREAKKILKEKRLS